MAVGRSISTLSELLTGVPAVGHRPVYRGAAGWKSEKQLRVDLRDFGVYPSSGNDETTGMQQAIDQAEVVRGVVEMLAGGEYNATALVIDTQGVSLVGGGRNGTVGAGVGSTLQGIGANADVLTVKADAIHLENFQVNGYGNRPGGGAAATGTGRGLVVYDGVAGTPTQSRVTVSRVWVRYHGGVGLYAPKNELLALRDSWVTNNGGIGILIEAVGSPLSRPTNVGLDNVRAAANLGAHQIHLIECHTPVLVNVQALDGNGSGANLRFQSCYAPDVRGADCERGGAIGLQISGLGGRVQGKFVALATGINATAWTDGIVGGCQFTSDVTTSINLDSVSRVQIDANSDASSGGMTWNQNGEVSLWRHRQAPGFPPTPFNFTPNPMLGEYVELGAMTANVAIVNPTKRAKGARLTFRFLQDGTGGRTVTWGADFKHAWSDTGNTANKQSTISFAFDGTNWVQQGAQSPYI